jgi:hypothetical protein
MLLKTARHGQILPMAIRCAYQEAGTSGHCHPVRSSFVTTRKALAPEP